MLTLRAAATLLAQADSLPALRSVATALGFEPHGIALTADAREDLSLGGLIACGEVSRGGDTLRLLTATLPHGVSGGETHGRNHREATQRICSALVRRAPTRHWCLLTLDARARTLCIATVAQHPGGPRIAALRIDRERVVDSDAETMRALASVPDRHSGLRHARFSDILRRDALSARFYRELESTVRVLAETSRGPGSASEQRELALLCASRCLFLAFLEAKGWLDGDRNFLLRQATSCLERGSSLHDRLLRPLFFGTLNTPRRHRSTAARAFGDVPFLNGGLFSPTPLERVRRTVRFENDALVALLGDLLDRYRFTAHEDSTAWSEAAVDPEMLGRAFECLMATDERRRSGSFYTPPALVDQVVRDALMATLPETCTDVLRDGSLSATMSDASRAVLSARVDDLRVLDPACGSGAFLVHVLERLATLKASCGDTRATHVIRRDILARSIFGVDRNPMAVWLCELRLWLSVVIDCPGTSAADIPPLPNLDHHIRIGDSLGGGDFQFAPASARRLSGLRDRYTRATGRRKVTLAASLDREERCRAIAEMKRRLGAVVQERRELQNTLRARDLFGERESRARPRTGALFALRCKQRELLAQCRRLELGGALPFRFAAHFADVAEHGGFSVVLGNPPWVRPHALPLAERQSLRAEFGAMRHAAWLRGAKRAGAGTGFAAQADVSVAFLERATRLLAPGGTMAMLVPAKLWRTLAGGGIRRLLTENARLHTVRDWSDAPALFDAAVYPSLVVARRPEAMLPEAVTAHGAASPNRVHVSVAARDGSREFDVTANRLSLDGDPCAPWVLLPPEVRAAFDKLRTAGPALGDSGLGRPTLGVKCGYNAAFLVQAVEHEDACATVSAAGRSAVIERHMLRPVLRGEHVPHAGMFVTTHASEITSASGEHTVDRIVWTHGTDGAPLRVLPPATARWMSHWRKRLETRGDARGRQPWWTLFRTDAARYDAPRVVWADIGKRLRTTVLPAGDPTVPLNTCYVLRTASDVDAWALHALLASPLTAAWLDTLAEPARGGFRRYLGWTVSTLPVPENWASARNALADIGRCSARGVLVSDDVVNCVTADAYGVEMGGVQALLDWHIR
ncbi:MAG: N-6 DNA methylase [Gemmatimonas sp.]